MQKKSIIVSRIIMGIISLSSAVYLIHFMYTDIQASMTANDMAVLHNEALNIQHNLGESLDTPVQISDISDIPPISEKSKPVSENTSEAMTTDITTIQESITDKTTDISATQKSVADVPEIETLKPLKIMPSMQELWHKNNDTVGWLKISDTKIDNIVVQSTDNDYYLHTNFDGEESQPGTLFVDYRCCINDYEENQSSNIIIYGHKQLSGTMFGTLTYYKNNLKFYKDNPTIEFSTLYKEYTYKIVSVFVAATKEQNAQNGIVFDYQNYIDLSDKERYDDFIEQITSRSQISTSVDTKYGDSFLTLSTCSYEFDNARFVVVARRTRENESTTVDTSTAKLTNTTIY